MVSLNSPFPIYGFLVVSSMSNIWPNPASLRAMIFQNLSELDIDLSRRLKVKCDGFIELPTYGFLLICIVTNYLSLTV